MLCARIFPQGRKRVSKFIRRQIWTPTIFTSARAICFGGAERVIRGRMERRRLSCSSRRGQMKQRYGTQQGQSRGGRDGGRGRSRIPKRRANSIRATRP